MFTWQSDGELLVHVSGGTVARLRQERDDTWREISRFDIPLPNFYRYSPIVAVGQVLIGEYQTPTSAPDLFLYEEKTGNMSIVTRTNPQINDLTLAQFDNISWLMPNGTPVSGMLFKPPNYVPGRRYPLVFKRKEIKGGLSVTLVSTTILHLLSNQSPMQG